MAAAPIRRTGASVGSSVASRIWISCLVLSWTLTCLPATVAQTEERVALDVSAVEPLLALKSAFRLTFTDWSDDFLCYVHANNFPAGGGWKNVRCNSNGDVMGLTFRPNFHLSGKLPKEITELTALQSLNLGANRFNEEIGGFLQDVLTMTTLKTIFLNNNFFYGSLPAGLFKMPYLTALYIESNYLTGTVPAIAPPLTRLSLGQNFLTGDFPARPKSFLCQGASNCFASWTACDANATMRADAECNVCGKPKGTVQVCRAPGVCKATRPANGTVVPMACHGEPASGGTGAGVSNAEDDFEVTDEETSTDTPEGNNIVTPTKVGKSASKPSGKKSCIKKRASCRSASCQKGFLCIPYVLNCNRFACIGAGAKKNKK